MYVIVLARNNKRVLSSPCFKYPQQAIKHIEKHCGGSKCLTIKKVGDTICSKTTET